MGFQNRIFPSDMNAKHTGATKLPNQPKMSATDLKKAFDAPSKDVIAPKFNGLIDELEASSAAIKIGAVAPQGLTGNTVQSVISGLAIRASEISSVVITKADRSELADVAFSGAYADLSGVPIIPRALADLEDDSTHRVVTDAEKTAWNAKAEVSDIPTSLSELSDDSTHRVVTDTEKSRWSAKADISDIPTSLSALQDDSTHRLVTDTEKTTWNGVSDKMETDGSNAESLVYFEGQFANGGNGLYVSGAFAHAEGASTYASGDMSHAEGEMTYATALAAHAEGTKTEASARSSHAEGWYTKAGYGAQHVCGLFNDNKATTIFEVGNGNSDVRSNAFEVYNDGTLSTDNGTTKVKLETLVEKYIEQSTYTDTGAFREFSFTDAKITTSGRYEYYCDVFGVAPYSVSVSSGSMSVTFKVSDSVTKCGVTIKGV